MNKMQAGYDLYVASCSHATIVTEAFELPLTHHWLELAKECGNLRGEFSKDKAGNLSFSKSTDQQSKGSLPANNKELIAVWKSRKPNLFSFYEDIFQNWTKYIASFRIIACVALLSITLSSPSMLYKPETQGVVSDFENASSSHRNAQPSQEMHLWIKQ